MKVDGLALLAGQAVSVCVYALVGHWLGMNFDWRFAFGAAVLSGIVNIMTTGETA